MCIRDRANGKVITTSGVALKGTSTQFGGTFDANANSATIVTVAQKSFIRISVGGIPGNISDGNTLVFQADHDGSGSLETFTVTFKTDGTESSSPLRFTNRAATIKANGRTQQNIVDDLRTLFTAVPGAGSGFNSGAGSSGWAKSAVGDIDRNGGQFKGFTVQADTLSLIHI